jgi:hypothetical protein
MLKPAISPGDIGAGDEAVDPACLLVRSLYSTSGFENLPANL